MELPTTNESALGHYDEDTNNNPTMKGQNIESRSLLDESSMALSLIYGLFIVVLTAVISLSQYLTTEVDDRVFLYYFLILYCIGILWLSYCCIKMSQKTKRIRTKVTSNMWLTGVVMLFGFAIMIKDALELVITIKASYCHGKWLKIALVVFHVAFILLQVVFLSYFATTRLSASRHLSRFGIAHVLVTNLSMWISDITEEANELLEHLEKNIAEEKSIAEKVVDAPTSFNKLTSEVCACSGNACSWMSTAVRFLWPFQIEFCLVCSCLLYIMWKNVGQKAPKTHSNAKPCYKLYGSYKGICIGAIIFLSTIAVITVLQVLGWNPEKDQEGILTKYQYIAMHHGFVIACKCTIIVLCIIAFSLELVTKMQKRENMSANLDTILLFGCLIGPFILDFFSIFSLLNGKDIINSSEWNIFLVLPMTDIIANVVQILFIVYWLTREPAMKKCEQSEKVYYNNGFMEDLRCSNSHVNTISQTPAVDKSLRIDGETIILHCKSSSVTGTAFHKSDNQKYITQADTKVTTEVKNELNEENELTSKCRSLNKISFNASFYQSSVTRLVLREIALVLVFINASLWLFTSLEGILFEVLYAYEYKFFGPEAWTALSSLASPLSIYLSMHSAACLFEIWSHT